MAATSVAAVKAAWCAAKSRASPARQASTSQIAANQNRQSGQGDQAARRGQPQRRHDQRRGQQRRIGQRPAQHAPQFRAEKAPRGYPVPFFLAQRSNSSAAATAAVPWASRATSHGCGARPV